MHHCKLLYYYYYYLLVLLWTERQKPECFTKAAGDYTKFVMYKENTDTLHAISVMAKYLRYDRMLASR